MISLELSEGISETLENLKHMEILKSYDLEDNLLEEYFAYDRKTREGTKEYHHS